MAFITTPGTIMVLSFVLQQQQGAQKSQWFDFSSTGLRKSVGKHNNPLTIKGVQLNILWVTTRSVAKNVSPKLRAKLATTVFLNRPRQDNVFFFISGGPSILADVLLEDAWGQVCYWVVIDEGLGAYMRSPWGAGARRFSTTPIAGNCLCVGCFIGVLATRCGTICLKGATGWKNAQLLRSWEKFLPTGRYPIFTGKPSSCKNTPVSSKLKAAVMKKLW